MRIYELWARPMRKFRISLKRRPGSSGAVGNRFFADRSLKKSVTPERARKTKTNWVRPTRGSYLPCFAYQSALIGVKLFHFSGRSSSAKIAVTGQTGTQAPQSMHSVG